MDPEAEIVALLASLDARADLPDEHELCGAFRALEARLREAGLQVPWKLPAEVIAFRFSENHASEQSESASHYGPIATLSNDKGEVLEVPSIKDVTAETLAYWARRAREAKHPIMRFRYGDLPWDLAPKVQGASRDPDGARIAIDAALELAGRPDTKSRIGRVKLTRALGLAKSLRDAGRFELVRDAMIAFMSRTARGRQGGDLGVLL